MKLLVVIFILGCFSWLVGMAFTFLPSKEWVFPFEHPFFYYFITSICFIFDFAYMVKIE